MSKDKKNAVSEMVHKLVYHQQLTPYFDKGKKIINESEILLPDGRSFRPDRVVIEENNVIIIDYKTGQKKDIHLSQMNHYAKLLSELEYHIFKKILVYIGKQIEVIEMI